MKSAHNRTISTPLRVRIHLNLACPEKAESSIKVQSENGGWITLGYATDMVLENVRPVVHTAAQKKIADTGGRKSPHAFLEGDLISFAGRMRQNIPKNMTDHGARLKTFKTDVPPSLKQEFNRAVAVNYNPRFASCFYRDHADKGRIDQKFISARRLIVRGWIFKTVAPKFTKMQGAERVENYQESLAQSSEFERKSLAKGRATRR